MPPSLAIRALLLSNVLIGLSVVLLCCRRCRTSIVFSTMIAFQAITVSAVGWNLFGHATNANNTTTLIVIMMYVVAGLFVFGSDNRRSGPQSDG